MKALRLTSKATRIVVDFHIHSLDDFVGRGASPDLQEITPLPWPNLIKISLTISSANLYANESDDYREYQRNFEHLVTLNLPKLESLDVDFVSAMPLTLSNWPNLTSLRLGFRKPSFEIEYPDNIQFPKFSELKKLNLTLMDPDQTRSVVKFLKPLLISCDSCTDFILAWDSPWSATCTIHEDAGEIIKSTPLVHVTRLRLENIWSEHFSQKIFPGRWLALQELYITAPWNTPMHLSTISNFTWLLKKLKVMEFSSWNSLVQLVPIKLSHFLQDLSHYNAAVEILSFFNLNPNLMLEPRVFINTKLKRLKSFTLGFDGGDGLQYDRSDVSPFFKALFESEFDELEYLHVIETNNYLVMCDNTGTHHEWMCRWVERPRKRLLKAFPRIKKISLEGLNLSADVREYLRGDGTRCSLDLRYCGTV